MGNQYSTSTQGQRVQRVFRTFQGFKFVIADYSQIELRLAAELIGIPQMIEAFQNGADLHSLTASLIYHVPIDEVEKSQRQMGKTLNFALLYGMGFKNTNICC